MVDYNEFRVVLTPDLQAQGTWNVLLEECPLAVLSGPKGAIQPNVTPQQLARLRSRHGWPNLDELKTIGQGVWNSLMTTNLETAFVACLAQSQGAQRGMRLIVSMRGESSASTAPGQIRLQELPLEVMYTDEFSFLATNPVTPVSRSLQFKPDRDPYVTPLPLRMLVMVAAPQDMPPVNVQGEKDVILQALSSIAIPGGAIEMEFANPPTRQVLTECLQKGFHIFHFIGHGAYDIVGDDPSPRPHICLEDANHMSDPLDADTLEIMLENSNVRLVVMTACSTANPDPAQEPYATRAFDGVAQRLIAGISDVSAAVAMQFDLEDNAAVAFSRTFYTNLLGAGRTLDEIVSMCRQALAGQMGAGHRAWVTPVVYWRCKGGKVFEVQAIKSKMDEESRRKRIENEITLKSYLDTIAWARNQPDEVQAALDSLVAAQQQKIEALQKEIGQLLGETLRLRGGAVSAGGTIQCSLTLRMRTPAQIGNVNARISLPSGKVSFVSAAAGAAIPGAPPFVSPSGDQVDLLWQNISLGVQWNPDEFELAVINLKVLEATSDPFIEIDLSNAKVQKDGVMTDFDTLNAVLFISE
jgi:hypothetical protein